jgi:hypothetical protein
LQPFLDFPQPPRHQQLAAGVQQNEVFAPWGRLDPPDALNVDNDRSADAQKQLRRQLGFQIGNRFAEDGIISRGFDVIDVLDFYKQGLITRFLPPGG